MNTARHAAVDRYPLSPLQQSMLDECLSAPEGSRIGLLQVICDLPEPIDATAFRSAWQQVAARHPILRTRIARSGQTAALQEVVCFIEIPWTNFDITAMLPTRQEDLLKIWLIEDRRRGLDLARAPLLRVMLARLSPHHHRMVLTIHHLLYDGRTVLALMREVFATYEAL